MLGYDRRKVEEIVERDSGRFDDLPSPLFPYPARLSVPRLTART
jgi:hypothetical protein